AASTEESNQAAINFIKDLHFLDPQDTVLREKCILLTHNAGPAILSINPHTRTFHVLDFSDFGEIRQWRLRLTAERDGVIIHAPYGVDYVVRQTADGNSIV